MCITKQESLDQIPEISALNRYCGVSQIYWKISLHEERAIITTRIQPAPISAILVLVTASTLSLVAVSMLTIQEASAEKKCNNNDDANNHNNDHSKTCANQQQEHSKNRDPSTSNTNTSPFL
ncbi:MAG: hypothetical protein ACJ72U_08815 [Nitrososphaeraceae archaeon]